MKLVFAFAAFALSQAALAGGRSEASLSDLKAGRRFEILEEVSVAIPVFLRLMESIPPLEVTETSLRLVAPPGTFAPVCLVSGLALNPDFPNQLKLPKGATIQVESVEPGTKAHPLYVGRSVSFAIREPGTRIKAQLRCFPGKGARDVMTVEAFEKVFRQKVRLLSDP